MKIVLRAVDVDVIISVGLSAGAFEQLMNCEMNKDRPKFVLRFKTIFILKRAKGIDEINIQCKNICCD